MKLAGIFLCLISVGAYSQTLTIEKIMQDPKWIGSSPTGVFWGSDGKTIYFNWNPDGKASDSTYSYTLGSDAPSKTSLREANMAGAAAAGTYNSSNTMVAFSYQGDIYLRNLSSGQTTRVTSTEEVETAPRFIMKDEWLVYTRNMNLFAWNIRTGTTSQLSNFSRNRIPDSVKTSAQDQFLQQQQLATSSILAERKKNGPSGMNS